MIKFIFGVLVGAGAGFAGGYFFKSRQESKTRDLEYAQMDKYYAEKYAKKYGEIKEEDPPAKVEDETDFTEVPKDYKSDSPNQPVPVRDESSLSRGSKERRLKKSSVDYTGFYENPQGDIMNDSEYDENYQLGKQLTDEMSEAAGPVVISDIDFGKNPSLKTMTLNYYMENGVLTVDDEADEDVIEDFQEVEALLGDTLIRSGFDDNRDEVLYVRNERMGTDYEIIKQFSAYEDV